MTSLDVRSFIHYTISDSKKNVENILINYGKKVELELLHKIVDGTTTPEEAGIRAQHLLTKKGTHDPPTAH